MTGRSAAGPTRREVTASLAARLGSAAEARWLVEHVAGGGWPGDGLTSGQVLGLATLAERRAAGEPLQYLLGTWPFRTIELAVDRRALIPRPETEEVVGVALGALGRPGDGSGDGPVVVDLGTGSGAVALSLAVELAGDLPGLVVWATDADADALSLAAENRDRVAAAWPGLGVAGRVRLARGSWFGALPTDVEGSVDLVVANPPYVAGEEWGSLDPEVRREPRRALVAAAGSDGTPGLADVEEVLAGAPRWLRPAGAVVVETAPHQAGAAAALARRLGYSEVEVFGDLAGRDRGVVARG